MKIWAHRGCSQMYPENTLLSFSKAVQIKGLTGIELDIQLTRDGQMVVIHDERVDRTTDGTGNVCEYSLAELKKLVIKSDYGIARIPAIEEVLDLLEPGFRNGLLLNIELKNSVIPYDGMEEKIIELVHKRGISESIVYSSFSAASVAKIKAIDKEAETGILASLASNTYYMKKGGCGADALHPYWRGIDMTKDELKGLTIRAWFGGHLYPEKPTGVKLDLSALEEKGITDVFLNEPERYLE